MECWRTNLQQEGVTPHTNTRVTLTQPQVGTNTQERWEDMEEMKRHWTSMDMALHPDE